MADLAQNNTCDIMSICCDDVSRTEVWTYLNRSFRGYGCEVMGLDEIQSELPIAAVYILFVEYQKEITFLLERLAKLGVSKDRILLCSFSLFNKLIDFRIERKVSNIDVTTDFSGLSSRVLEMHRKLLLDDFLTFKGDRSNLLSDSCLANIWLLLERLTRSRFFRLGIYRTILDKDFQGSKGVYASALLEVAKRLDKISDVKMYLKSNNFKGSLLLQCSLLAASFEADQFEGLKRAA